MNEFVLLFRSEALPERRFSPDEMQNIMQQWQAWMGGMAANGQLANGGNRLGGDGKTVRPSAVVTNGPYAEIKEMVTGFIVVKADTIDGAAELAKGCPILNVGGNVEVRNIIPMGSN
ncbi:MAG: YciI family protein [Mucilaginibacter sp.]